MAAMDFKSRKLRFTQGQSKFEYEVEQVAFKAAYRHAKWLLTLLHNGSPYQSEQFANDEDLLQAFGSLALNSDKVEMIENNYTTIKINV